MVSAKPFVFVHINKTGGSSIEQALARPLAHKTAREYIAEMGWLAWQQHYTFSVVRNPWDKVVSHYHWRIHTNQTALAERPLAFSEWVKRAYGEQDPVYYDKPKMFMPAIDWLVDESGQLVVKKIARFEHLAQDFQSICETLGIQRKLPHLKKTPREHYHHCYDDESQQIIADWFKRDIELFDYHF